MSIFIDTLTSAVTDGIEDTCESPDEKADCLERVIDSLTSYLNDLTGASAPAYRATAARAGLGVMGEVLDVVADRETVDPDVLAALTVAQVTDLYAAAVEPAIDTLEQALLADPSTPPDTTPDTTPDTAPGTAPDEDVHGLEALNVYRTSSGRDAYVVFSGGDDTSFSPVTNSDGQVRLAYLASDGTVPDALNTEYGWADPATLTPRPKVAFSEDSRRCTINTTDGVYVLEMDGDIPTVSKNGQLVGTLSLDDSAS